MDQKVKFHEVKECVSVGVLCVCVCVCVFPPISRVNVDVVPVPIAPPHKANAGGRVEGQQASDDDVALCSAWRHQNKLIKTFLKLVKCISDL